MLKILNKILTSQLDPGAVMTKLDEIEKGINEIRQSSSRRAIGNDASERIVLRIGRFKGQKAELHQAANDDEAREFTARVRDILKTSGWDVSIGGAIIVASTDGTPLKGIRIAVADAQSQPALELLNAMYSEGISIEGNTDSTVPPNVVRIDVRPKPSRQ